MDLARGARVPTAPKAIRTAPRNYVRRAAAAPGLLEDPPCDFAPQKWYTQDLRNARIASLNNCRHSVAAGSNTMREASVVHGCGCLVLKTLAPGLPQMPPCRAGEDDTGSGSCQYEYVCSIPCAKVDEVVVEKCVGKQ